MFALTNGNHFYIHLGMTGRLKIESSDAPLIKHTHLILDVCGADGKLSQIRFIDPRRFGGIFWNLGRADDDTLGPEPLDLTAADSGQATLAHQAHIIKSALLDQSVIAGLGNIYVDEGINPASIR